MTTKRNPGMPKGAKRIGEAERDMIRVGIAHGLNGLEIAACLGRGKSTIYAAIDRMERAGTLGQTVFGFVDLAGGDDNSNT